MRWKLLLSVSLLATIVGVGLCLATAWWLSSFYGGSLAAPNPAAYGVLILPLASITYAGIFIYRHTSRRRPLQAILTVSLALLLTLAALLAASMLFARSVHYTVPFLSSDKFIGERKK